MLHHHSIVLSGILQDLEVDTLSHVCLVRNFILDIFRGVRDALLNFVHGSLHVLLEVFPTAQVDDRQLLVVELHEAVDIAVGGRRIARVDGFEL